jgi:hypothetical protein
MWGAMSFRPLLLLMLMFRRCIWQIKLFCGFSSSFDCLAGVQCARLVDLSRGRARCPGPGMISLDRGRGRMRVAITFRDQPKNERCEHEYRYSPFCRSEAKPLPHFIKFETPALFNHEWTRMNTNTFAEMFLNLIVRCCSVASCGGG